MKLDEETIKKFKELYLKEYGRQLTNEQAIDYGTRLIRLVKAVCGNNLSLTGFDSGIKKRNNINELK